MSASAPRDALPPTVQALGGPALTALTPWAILFIPTIALTAYQEIGASQSSVLVGILACVLPSAGAALVFLAARALRRDSRTIPFALCILLWASVGVVHGVVGGLVAQLLTGTAPHYPARVAFWVLSCLIWFPLVTYVVAQYDYRRELLTSLESELKRAQSIRRSSMWELAEMRTVIVGAIRDHIRPELIEITRSLELIGPSLDSDALAALGAQIANVSEEAARIIDTVSVDESVPSAVPVSQSSPPSASALEYVRGRSVLVAALVCIDLLPLLVAISFRSADIRVAALVTEALCVLSVLVLLVAGIALLTFAARRPTSTRIRWTLAMFAVTGIAAGSVALFGPWQPANGQNIALAALLPFAVPLAASALAAALGLGLANIGTVRQIAAVHLGIVKFNEELDHSREDIRNQISAVTHGPLRGRLAACAMALNFHAAEITTSPPARTEYVITSVREHLADVLEELDVLG